MLKSMIITAMMAVLALADAPVLKTGQTTSYRAGDDGAYQKGIARSYTRDDVNGTVTDNATHLEWQDDAVGSTMTWTDAGTYCNDLTLDGKTDWRLPTVEELVSITDKGHANPSINTIYFQNVTSSVYWSSTTLASDSSYAWLVYFDYGYDRCYGKAHSVYVRCVRSGQ